MRPNLIRHSSLATLVGLGLLVAGCGSSSTKMTSTAAALPKAQYLARANAICKQGDAAQNAATNGYFKAHHINPNKQPTAAQLTGFARTVAIPNIQSQINAIKALGAPSGDEQKVGAMIAAAQADLEKVKANPAVLSKGDPFAAHSAKLLHAYGLKACATGH